MAPFEALYGRGCRSHIGFFYAENVKPLGVVLVKDTKDKVSRIQTKLMQIIRKVIWNFRTVTIFFIRYHP